MKRLKLASRILTGLIAAKPIDLIGTQTTPQQDRDAMAAEALRLADWLIAQDAIPNTRYFQSADAYWKFVPGNPGLTRNRDAESWVPSIYKTAEELAECPEVCECDGEGVEP
jgi:hypothetical protein